MGKKRKLTEKQKMFVVEYLVDLNATQAAIRAGYSEKTAYRTGADNLKKPQIQAAIREQLEAREARTLITADRVLKEYAKLAFSDITDYLEVITERVVVDWDVNPETGEKVPIWEIKQLIVLRDTKDIPRDKLAAIQCIKHGRYGLEFTLHDKKGALDSIGKHLGMFVEKREVNLSTNNPLEGLTTEELRQLIADEG
jgi:phage terminase small subunit